MIAVTMEFGVRTDSTPVRRVRLAIPWHGGQAMLKRSLIILSTVLAGATLVHAQNMPTYGYGYGYGGYAPTSAPAAANPYAYYGYAQPNTQPYQRVQYPYYPPNAYGQGYYYNARPYNAPNYYAPNYYGYQNGYGVNYYTMRNPVGYTPTPAPYGAVANQRALESTPSYVSSGGPSIYQPGPMMEPEDGFPGVDNRAPIVYHRKPCDCFWLSGGYLGTIITPMRVQAPLVTTGSPNAPIPGVLGDPSTAILFGGNNINFNLLSGLRLEAGVFLDSDARFSLDWSGFYLLPGTQTANFSSDSNGNPVLTRPIFNIGAGREGGFLNSLPGFVTGNINVDARTQFSGTEFNFGLHGYYHERLHAEGLFGFRYVRLAESLTISEGLRNITPGFISFQGVPVADTTSVVSDFDSFSTLNQFFGPQIGGRLRYEEKWFNVDGFAKLAIGANYQRIDINGATTLNSAGSTQTAAGGILALPSNIGSHTRTVFSVVPEFGLAVSANLTQNIRLQLGYSLMLWSQVARPGAQIDRNVNTGQVPGSPPPNFGVVNGPTAPIFRFNDEFFWAHNFNIGVEVHF
jgi:hypothetical protein